MSVECQVNVKSQSELDIGGRETCCDLRLFPLIPDLTTISLRALKWPPNELKMAQNYPQSPPHVKYG